MGTTTVYLESRKGKPGYQTKKQVRQRFSKLGLVATKITPSKNGTWTGNGFIHPYEVTARKTKRSKK